MVRIPPVPAAPAPAPTFNLFLDELRFRIPARHVTEVFEISQTQGPIAFVANQVFLYHPLFEMNMYEVPSLGADMYQFIDNNITPNNPALIPALLGEETKKKNKKV